MTSVLVEAGVGVTEHALHAFKDPVQHKRSMGEYSGPELPHFLSSLKSLVQALGGFVDGSRLHSDMYNLAWELALHHDCSFAFDLLIDKTGRMPIASERALRKVLLAASRQADLELLQAILCRR